MPNGVQPVLRRLLAAGLLLLGFGTLWAQGPVLQVELLPTSEVRLAWPASAGSFQLEEAPELQTNPEWSVVPGTPTESNGTWSLSVTPSAASRLFRLRSLPGSSRPRPRKVNPASR